MRSARHFDRWPAWFAFAAAAWIGLTAGCFSKARSSGDGAAERRVGEDVAEAAPPGRAIAAPPLAETRFQNASPTVGEIGVEACKKCHPHQHESFLKTPHSRALADIDPAGEPADGEFVDEASNRAYRVYRQDGKLRHRESMRLADGGELTLADYPLDYVIGSGSFARTYLLELDGFLVESPVTWYAARSSWGLSPGYADDPDHQGFARAAEIGCIRCHVGNAEPIGQAVHKMAIHEQAIGCERCHGPGERHAAARRESAAVDGPDFTICNPIRLSRDRLNDVCSQCHLASKTHANVRGREKSDFRPGQRLSDFFVAYVEQGDDQSMTVVGHVEQMKLSRCYQQSDSMTCITCHDPHFTPDPAARDAWYRDRCLSCHEEQACGLEAGGSRRSEVSDNCQSCHMPKSETDIPHLAFRHHRVGIHEAPDAPPAPASAELSLLRPVGDISHLSELDQRRCLGLAYMELGAWQESPQRARDYSQRGLDLLQAVWDAGVRDPELENALARLQWKRSPKQVILHAGAALEYERIPVNARAESLDVLATTYFDLNMTQQAEPLLAQLVGLRRSAQDWLLLGLCRSRRGDARGALEAAEMSVKIRPDRPDLREFSASVYGALGQHEMARQRAIEARLLHESRPAKEPQAARP